MKLLANRVEIMGQFRTKFLHTWDENIAKDTTRIDLASVEQIGEERSSLAASCTAKIPSLVFFASQDFFMCGKKGVVGCN
jgi:hypothetical protein